MIIFIVIAILFTIGFIVTFYLVRPKQEMLITSEILIARPKDKVWSYVHLLRNQEHYNTWIMSDPNIKMDYRGDDGKPGFVATWQSKTRMGDGEQEILSVKEGESFDTELRFRNHQNRTHVKTKIEEIANGQTKVTTIMSATPAFPMNMMIPMMTKMMKKSMDQNSAMLKKILEA